MLERIRDKIRELVRSLNYVMTLHAEEEMESDEFSIIDVEEAILNGEISERQRDKSSGEWKYVIVGKSLDDRMIGTVSKLSVNGKLVIITVFEVNEEYEN